MKQLLQKYKHAWVLLYGFIYLPWFLYLEKHVTRDYYVLHTKLDDLIPFSEYFIIPYFLWFLYVSAAILFFFFKDRQDYYRLCVYLFTGMTLSLIICTVFHNGTDLRPTVDPEKNIFSWMVWKLHQADTSTNIFPSVHVFNSIVIHVSVMKSEHFKNRRFVRMVSFVLAFSICMSTVVLKQHSVVDVMGSILMAYGLYPVVYGHQYLREQGDVRPRRVFTLRRSA